jgi:HAD superfamily hydrolase (TIGR01484 family)
MQDLRLWPLGARRRITGVLTDIDDTLATEGAITADALGALHALHAAGFALLAVTGRPAGWSAPFAAAWPLDGIVAENGAVLLSKKVQDGSQPAQTGHCALSKRYQQDAATRAANGLRLQAARQRIEREVPGAQPARDSSGRETDIAIDHGECKHLDSAQIAAVLRIMQAEGLQATVSSIHINGWIGGHNKLQGAAWAVRTLFGRDLLAERDCWAFIGDSTNDALMFEAFDQSTGVANIARFAPQLSHPPRYLAAGERGAGFAEFAHCLLAAKAPGKMAKRPLAQ